jgi:hypothetical protein
MFTLPALRVIWAARIPVLYRLASFPLMYRQQSEPHEHEQSGPSLRDTTPCLCWLPNSSRDHTAAVHISFSKTWRSYLRILRATNKFRSEDPQFRSYLWTSHLSGGFCSVHETWYAFLCKEKNCSNYAQNTRRVRPGALHLCTCVLRAAYYRLEDPNLLGCHAASTGETFRASVMPPSSAPGSQTRLQTRGRNVGDHLQFEV